MLHSKRNDLSEIGFPFSFLKPNAKFQIWVQAKNHQRALAGKKSWGTADEVVDCSHGKQLYELCKEKYEPLWINGGGHCNLELYPVYIKHLKKFVLGLGKSKTATNGSHKPSLVSDTKKPAESVSSNTLNLHSDLPEISRNSLDSRLDKAKKSNKPEKSRMSTGCVDRFRRRKGLVW